MSVRYGVSPASFFLEIGDASLQLHVLCRKWRCTCSGRVTVEGSVGGAYAAYSREIREKLSCTQW